MIEPPIEDILLENIVEIDNFSSANSSLNKYSDDDAEKDNIQSSEENVAVSNGTSQCLGSERLKGKVRVRYGQIQRNKGFVSQVDM